MNIQEKIMITVTASVNAPIDKVWEFWTGTEHICRWNNASNDWHTTRAENNLQVGGKFLSRMEAKDGSMGFDFEGTYDAVKTNELIEYSIIGGRKVIIKFSFENNQTTIIETFEAEAINSVELQKNGWQSILNNFKSYSETTFS
ncbi:MAG: SRPBCC family protein [Candidatus Kapabacteria bacterium]|nr:SRPBCC family protein [Candidatus Kapabacteria bacterium]